MQPGRIFRKPHYIFRPSQVIRRLAYERGSWPDGQTVVTRLPWGATIECWPTDALGRSILCTGIYDLLATEALLRLTEPGDTAVDVGANVGHMTSALAHAVGLRGRVVAFEPHPEVHAVLQRNAARWSADAHGAPVELHAAAASDRASTVVLLSGKDFASNRGTSRVQVGAAPHDSLRTSVPAVRLDETVTSAVGVLKLDCEGHEGAALAGAARLLERGMIRDVVFEEFASYPTPVTQLLEAAGFEVMALCQRLAGPVVTAPSKPSVASWDPPVFVASREADRVRERMRGHGWRALRSRVRPRIARLRS